MKTSSGEPAASTATVTSSQPNEFAPHLTTTEERGKPLPINTNTPQHPTQPVVTPLLKSVILYSYGVERINPSPHTANHPQKGKSQ